MTGLRALLSKLRQRAIPAPPRSALIVPVVEADVATSAARSLHDPSSAGGMPAHVTVLWPFVAAAEIDDALVEELRGVLATSPAFAFDLARVDRFPGVTYLAPNPPDPFVALTRLVVGHWPDHEPYEGRFAEVIPHMTVAVGREPEAIVREIERQLPIPCRAAAVVLMVEGEGRWRERARFELA